MQKESKNSVIVSLSNRTFKTLESIDADTKILIDKVSKKGYIMNKEDNREMKMRIEAIKSVMYGC